MSEFSEEELLKILTSGCDERIFLREETQANKYHLNPINFSGLFHRGSCTCGTLTPFGQEVAKEFALSYKKSDYPEILKGQTKRLQALLRESDEDQFHVYYGPSGSDLKYLPLLFFSFLNPDNSITNIVSCPEELGSGSKSAAKGEYYSEWNQFGERIPIAEKVSELIESDVHFLPARAIDGSVLDRKKAITSAVTTLDENEVLLIAGKGHETTQIIGSQILPFSDIEVALNALI